MHSLRWKGVVMPVTVPVPASLQFNSLLIVFSFNCVNKLCLFSVITVTSCYLYKCSVLFWKMKNTWGFSLFLNLWAFSTTQLLCNTNSRKWWHSGAAEITTFLLLLHDLLNLMLYVFSKSDNMFRYYQVSNRFSASLTKNNDLVAGSIWPSKPLLLSSIFGIHESQSKFDYKSVILLDFKKSFIWVLCPSSVSVFSVQKAQMHIWLMCLQFFLPTCHMVSDWELRLAKEDVKVLWERQWERNKRWKFGFPCFLHLPLL